MRVNFVILLLSNLLLFCGKRRFDRGGRQENETKEKCNIDATSTFVSTETNFVKKSNKKKNLFTGNF